MKLDDTQLSGNASAPSLSPLAVRFNLKADRIDLDRYLEPPDFKGDPLDLARGQAQGRWMRRASLRIANARVAGVDATGIQIKVE